MFLFFKNHFGMVISTIIAFILSLCMSLTAIFWDHLGFTIELMIRNWGTAFLTIMVITLLLPVKQWGDQAAGKLGLKEGSLVFGLVSNIVPTLFYNLGATLILVGTNLGFASPYYWSAVSNDLVLMFFVSYVLSLAAERVGMLVAFKSCTPPQPHI